MKTTLLLTALSVAVSASVYAQPDREGPPQGPRGWRYQNLGEDWQGEFRGQQGQRRGQFWSDFGTRAQVRGESQGWNGRGQGLGRRQGLARGPEGRMDPPSCRCPDCPVGRMLMQRFGPNDPGQGQVRSQARGPRGGGAGAMPRRGMGPQWQNDDEVPGFAPRGRGWGRPDDGPRGRGFGGPPQWGGQGSGDDRSSAFSPPRRGFGRGPGLRGRSAWGEDVLQRQDRPDRERPSLDEGNADAEQDN